jgi:hypothetical protein
MSVRPMWKASAEEVLRKLKSENRLCESTVVLVGSAARSTETGASDIDILVIEPRRLPRFDVEPKVQLFTMTRKQFIDRLQVGDDFPHWAVRFGKVLSDIPDWWNELLQHPSTRAWPNWRRKARQAASRLSYASRLFSSGDYDHAREEYLLAARHLARGVLLKHSEFPLSQPELPGQLRKIGCDELGTILDTVVDDSVDGASLSRCDRRLAHCLKVLGEEDHTQFVHEEIEA